MAVRLASFVLVLTSLMTHPGTAVAQTTSTAARNASEPIEYTVSFPAPHTHYVEISAVVPTGERPSVDLMMAVWTPGSYLVREFERNVESVTAAAPDGRTLAVEKSDKNHWRVSDRWCADRLPCAIASTATRCRFAPTGSRPGSRS